MRVLAAIVLLLMGVASAQVPAFKTQEIDASLKIGYGVLLVDINADQKPDIVVCDKERVIWFENPTWNLRVITEGKTAPDNVCIDAHDIDGDGTLDLALGANWQPSNTKDHSTLQWLRRGKTLDDPWEIFPIAYNEPTLHRMRFADVDGSGKKVLVTVPLMGRGTTKSNSWNEAGVRVELRTIPPDPTKFEWPAETITQSPHVAHNVVISRGRMYIASFEGVTMLQRLENGSWSERLAVPGDQKSFVDKTGASEVKVGHFTPRGAFIATIEPWHGHQVVAYPFVPPNPPRIVIDDQLRWGHAIWCADLDADGNDEIIDGVRDPLPGKAKSGVRVYRAADATGTKWNKSELDPGGVAVEDLAVADLNGDHKPDIVAVGRQTQNVRIYWNQGK
jgi:hypothetical protein